MTTFEYKISSDEIQYFLSNVDDIQSEDPIYFNHFGIVIPVKIQVNGVVINEGNTNVLYLAKQFARLALQLQDGAMRVDFEDVESCNKLHLTVQPDDTVIVTNNLLPFKATATKAELIDAFLGFAKEVIDSVSLEVPSILDNPWTTEFYQYGEFHAVTK